MDGWVMDLLCLACGAPLPLFCGAWLRLGPYLSGLSAAGIPVAAVPVSPVWCLAIAPLACPGDGRSRLRLCCHGMPNANRRHEQQNAKYYTIGRSAGGARIDSFVSDVCDGGTARLGVRLEEQRTGDLCLTSPETEPSSGLCCTTFHSRLDSPAKVALLCATSLLQPVASCATAQTQHKCERWRLHHSQPPNMSECTIIGCGWTDAPCRRSAMPLPTPLLSRGSLDNRSVIASSRLPVLGAAGAPVAGH